MIKSAMLAAGIAILIAGPAAAKEEGAAGVGVILGNPTGATGKYFFSPVRAVQAGLGYSGGTVLYADHLWHGWSVFPKPPEGSFNGYLGVGGRLEFGRHDAEVGIRTVGGAAYWLEDYPVEIFAELVPLFRLAPDGRVELDAGIGLRYYFGVRSRKSPSTPAG